MCFADPQPCLGPVMARVKDAKPLFALKTGAKEGASGRSRGCSGKVQGQFPRRSRGIFRGGPGLLFLVLL